MNNRIIKKVTIFGTILMVLAVILIFSTNTIDQWLWMKDLNYVSVFTTMFSVRIILMVIGFLINFVLCYIVLKNIQNIYVNQMEIKEMKNIPPFFINAGVFLFSLLIGFTGLTLGDRWEVVLKYWKHQPFHIQDPFFAKDVSFYLFELPFYQMVLNALSGSIFFMLFISVFAMGFVLYHQKNRMAQIQLMVLVGIFGVLLSIKQFLKPYETLSTDRVSGFHRSVVEGLSYTDDLINIPKAYIMGVFILIITIVVLYAIYQAKWRMIAISIASFVVVAIIGQLASVVVQQFIVSPNEFEKEKPYLEHNLNWSRQAYGLDDIESIEHPGSQTFDADMVERNQITIDNIRINDARPLNEVYNQKQTFRTYYQFNDMDIDRYEIDGKYQQVFIGARELNTSDLPDQAQTWINQKLRYTHGYGVAMSHVNTIDSQGQPDYLIENIPPQGALEVTRPELYFGEEDYGDVIVGTKVDEFDYPDGENNQSTRFEGDSGIPLTGMQKLFYAWKDKSLRLLVSGQLTDDSRYLRTRNIIDRVDRIAPFFEYEKDPYLVIRDDGTLVWVIDAYLSAENYPYSSSYENDRNYIRNSVKVTVDAYTGDVHFYVVEEDEALLKTYQNMLPDLFTTDIPEDIQKHFRYPERLFGIQAEKYGTYHMSNLEVFYNREDVWQIPTEKYYDNDITMEPYYLTMKLQEEEKEEFVLTMPFTPRNRQNMIAWMGVRNDGDNYGDIFVYRFPKQKNVYGPQQIENRINQDSVISQELNLWSQGGSRAIRGNLITIPIEDTVIYVEPIYIESNNETALPEVKRIVVAYDDYIVMERTIEAAFERLLEQVKSGIPQVPVDDADEVEDPDELLSAEEKLEELAELFKEYEDALAEREWEQAASILRQIENELDLEE
ncbi:UPF0182 family protein [Aquibacillus albus]|uniref:UPF0182 protein JOC48_000472 n=1 Tax=Aquibacillus albus TaxID=1168171 RepID=A0ABS2MVR0_9BACI|nr:UPF0182 family protein [Aquibacillus albus]MBM7569994.1 uncharacterized membrane protein (UPF0182 family) [Aquibacillus albus]